MENISYLAVKHLIFEVAVSRISGVITANNLILLSMEKIF